MRRSVAVIPNLICPELDSGQTKAPSYHQRCGIHLVPGSSPGWQIPRASLERGCVHHSLFIVHYSLFIMHYETKFGVSLLCIMNCETKFGASQLWNSSWKHPLSIQTVGNPSSLTRFVILNSIQDRWIHSQAINVAAYDCPESSSGWRIKFRMTTDQVRDDKYREPHLKEDVSIIHCSLFIIHCSLCITKRSSA